MARFWTTLMQASELTPHIGARLFIIDQTTESYILVKASYGNRPIILHPGPEIRRTDNCPPVQISRTEKCLDGEFSGPHSQHCFSHLFDIVGQWRTSSDNIILIYWIKIDHVLL